MTAPTYCTTCEQTVHPTHPHSCFSAATLRAHHSAERAVIAAAKVWVDADAACVTAYGEKEDVEWARGMASTHGLWLDAKGQLLHAVAALRAVDAARTVTINGGRRYGKADAALTAALTPEDA